MVLQTLKILKGEVQLTVSSTLPIQQAIAYSISCCKAEKDTFFLQDGDKIKKGKNIDHWRTIPNIGHLPDPPTFSMVPTFQENVYHER